MINNNEVTIRFEGGPEMKVRSGSRLLDALEKVPQLLEREHPVVAAHVDNKLVSLHYTVMRDVDVRLIDLSHPDGQRVYERSVAFIMTYAAQKVLPKVRINVLHSYRNGIYCEAAREEQLTPEEVARIKEEMLRIVEQDLPIIPEAIDEETGIKLFQQMEDRTDAIRLLKYMPEHQRIFIYHIEDYIDYAYIPLAHRTGVLDRFDLVPYGDGMVILLPERLDVSKVARLQEQPKLFATFKESARWARVLGVKDVGSLNQLIASGHVSDFVKISEAFHEKKIAYIADEITKEEGRVKVVLIAGPSSSGKTTFSKRLAIQLRVNERSPITVSLDDYFVDREKTPIGEDGKPDFDSIDAIDVALFNENVRDLLNGKEVVLPKFNFKTGKRMPGRRIRMKPDDILIVEGIHGLNPRLTESIPVERTYRIYVSALTQISIDGHNRISTSDTRLIRRLVRDKFFRGHSALTTLSMWPSVRRGEEKHIFPYQENADIMFNSALLYELAVLKLYVEPMLEEVSSDVPEYADAVRLIWLLSHILGMLPNEVPPTSILREFIGGSSFKY